MDRGYKTFIGISWSTAFKHSSVIGWNSAKSVPKNSTVSVGIGLPGSSLLLICSILLTKNSLNSSGRGSGEMFEGMTVSPNAHHLITEMQKLPGTITVYIKKNHTRVKKREEEGGGGREREGEHSPQNRTAVRNTRQ